MKRVLAILVDAFRYDFLSDKYTPFLYSMSRRGFYVPLRPILGFSDAIRATVFTGTYPNVHNYWIMYRYSQETSPFRMFKPLKFIDYVPVDVLRRGLKFVLSATLCKILGGIYDYDELTTRNIPFKMIHLFDFASKRSMLSPRVFNGLPTLFDVLRKHNVKFSYLDSSKLRGRLLRVLGRLAPGIQVIVVYLHYLDYAAHRYGLNSSYFWRWLRNIDETVKSIVKCVKQHFGDELDVIVFSDHGMIETTKYLNFDWLLRNKKFGSDFLFFLDSTMVRLWYMNFDVKEEVRELFKKLGCGTFLSENERKKLRINFSHRYYGDDIYLLKPGYSIFPNFISWLKPKAMHAYHPKYDHQLGIAIFSGQELGRIDRNIKTVELVDVMPTILDVLGLEIPDSCEGSSLLHK